MKFNLVKITGNKKFTWRLDITNLTKIEIEEVLSKVWAVFTYDKTGVSLWSKSKEDLKDQALEVAKMLGIEPPVLA